MTLEIDRTLVLSTGHVTEATGKLLDAEAQGGEELSWSPQIRWEYGWIFYADADPGLGYPEEFAAIFAFAKLHDCKWIRFDCDGPQVEELPFQEW